MQFFPTLSGYQSLRGTTGIKLEYRFHIECVAPQYFPA